MADVDAKVWDLVALEGVESSADPFGQGGEPPPDPASWNLPATLNVQQDGTIGLRQYTVNATGWTISVSGLPAGVTYNASLERLEGASTGTASGTATFTLSLSGQADVVDTATVSLIEQASGFTVESGFSVELIDGDTLAHGAVIRITKTGGGFGAKADAPAWIVDDGEGAYVGGQRVDYPSVTDDAQIPSSVWRESVGPSSTGRMRFTTTRARRHENINAHYCSVAASESTANNKANISLPVWPDGRSYSDHLYVRWWQRVKNPYLSAGGGGEEDKIFRLEHIDSLVFDGSGPQLGGGLFWPLRAGINGTTGGAWDNPLPQTTDWVCFEVYFSKSERFADAYVNGRYWCSQWSGIPGFYESRPHEDYIEHTPSSETTEFTLPTGVTQLCPGWLGYDDNADPTQSVGQEIDISEPYVDTSFQFVEAVDGAYTVTAFQHREIFRALSWTDSQIEVVINAGSFASLSGKRLYVTIGAPSPRKGATRLLVGEFN